MKTHSCPRCGSMAKSTQPNRDALEHGAGHLAHHAKHHPALALLGLASRVISKLIPRAYHCPACEHTFSA